MLQFAHSTVGPQGQSTQKRINWSKVPNTNLYHYQRQVTDFVAPLIGHSYNSTDDIDKEIKYVSENICSIAFESLPLHKNSVKCRKWFNSLTTKRMPFGILFDCLYCWPQILDCGELVVCGHRKIK